MNIAFKKTSPENFSKVLVLLSLANLPIRDIDENVELFSLEMDLGTAGLEIFGRIGLLRSLSVLESQKGKGYELLIVQKLESYVKTKNIKALYLLTSTAKDFFETKCKYELIERINVPIEIQNSQQFVSICPSSAVIMKKDIAF
jgi:amino-acid N-acetyltransferase